MWPMGRDGGGADGVRAPKAQIIESDQQVAGEELTASRHLFSVFSECDSRPMLADSRRGYLDASPNFIL
jgi:hypothetical protein